MFITNLFLGNRTFAQLNITTSYTDVSCNGLNNGTITLTVSGGVAPYTFKWTDGISITNDSITLYPVKDNSIYQSHVNNSNGASEYLVAGQTGFGYNTRALMAFNLAGVLPSGAMLTNASLQIHQSLSSGTSGIQDMELHLMLQNWGEGTSATGGQAGQGAPATTNDATWLKSFYPNTSWTIAGGVFDGNISATTPVGNPDYYFWSDEQMLNDIQYWRNNSTLNYGWMLKGLESGLLQAKRFDSRENSSVANRPALTINYNTLTVISTSQNLTNLTPGNYTVVVTSANGTTASATVTIHQAPCSATLHLKLFIEGYYSNGTMTPVLFNNGLSNNPNAVDSITVELHNTSQPYLIYKTARTLLLTNGQAEITFGGINFGNSYYIAIKHRNNLETWSKIPVVMNANVNFDFTSQ